MAKKTISNSFTVNTVENGENAFDVTIDKQIVGVECDSSGSIVDSNPVTLHLSAHYGTGEDLIADCYISESHDDDAIMVSEVDTGVIGVEFTQGAYLAPSNPIVLTVRHPEYGARVVTFSVNRVMDGKNGKNSIRLDLDNESDTMLYDGAGNLRSGSVNTMATLYDGGEDVSNDATFSIQGYSGMDSTQVSISGQTITVSGMTADSGYVNVRALYNGYYYTHKFTLKKIVGVDKFDLVVSPNAVNVNTSNTTIADTTINIQVYRTPANGGTRQLVSWTKENGAYHAYGLTLVVKDGLNNTLTETTSDTPVDTRIFNLTGTMATNTNKVLVTLSKSSVAQDVETIPVSHVRNGQDGTGANAVRLDLDNGMDAIPTDATGKTLQAVDVQTTIRLYDGATQVSLATSDVVSVSPIVIGGTPYGGVKSGSGGITITWSIPANIQLDFEKTAATIVVLKDSKTYNTQLVVAVVKSGEEGVSPEILSLLPLPNQIVFSKDSSGTIPESSKTLSLKIKQTIGNTTEVKDVDQSGLTIRYSTQEMPASATAGSAWRGDISIPSTATYSNVYIAAFNGSTLVDRETIPLIKDGDKGESVRIESQHASYFDGEDADGNPKPTILSSVDLGKVDLINYEAGDLDMIDVVDEDGVGGYLWEAYTVPFGTCYIFNDHLYEATETGWADLGLFKGEKGDDAITYEVMCSRESITIPSGETSTSATISFNFFSKEGESPKQAFYTYLSLYKRGNDGTMTIVFNTAFKSPYARNLTFPATTSESAFVMYIWGDNGYTGNDPESQSYLAKAEVPVLKDGDAAVVYKIELEKSVFSYNPNKTSNNLTINIKGKVRRIEGSTSSIFDINNGNIMTHRVTENGTILVIPSISLDDTFYCNTTTNYSDDIALKISFRINGVEQAVESIPLVEKGERGKVGRFYYFAGTFNEEDNDTQFVVNDAQVPYFEHLVDGQKRYHVFNPETTPEGGSMTMYEMWEASGGGDRQQGSWNNAPWEVMTDDFKYLITQAIFGAYAHLGSWIFNNDYMLSEKDGDGVARGQRAYNGMDDNQLTTGFIPSIAFDALNGRASFGGDTVRFQPDGAGWLANKSIIWDEDGNASFSGFIKKTPTHITPENESEYIIEYFTNLYTFNFQKTGTFVVLQPNVSPDTLDLPCLYQSVSSRYNEEQKMMIRSYVGTKILLYNSSGHGLNIYYMYSSAGVPSSIYLGHGSCATAECKIRTESGFENVYWEFVHCGQII